MVAGTKTENQPSFSRSIINSGVISRGSSSMNIFPILIQLFAYLRFASAVS